jgi:hypothetical protein
MDTSRVKLAVKLAIPAVMLGLVVWYVWPILQQSTAHLPPCTRMVTGYITTWGIYGSLGLMTLGVVPPYNRWRIAVDLFCTGAFLVNLLYAKNSGNVALETALFAVTAWSVWANWHEHKPITATWREWFKAQLILAACYGFGLLVAWLWPVNEQTQYAGWYWPYIGLTGAVILTCAIIALETRVIAGDKWQYRVIYGAGCGLLVLSYLGEYNPAGLVLNTSLTALTYGPLLCKQFVRK